MKQKLSHFIKLPNQIAKSGKAQISSRSVSLAEAVSLEKIKDFSVSLAEGVSLAAAYL